jgi:pSer/pThr/pTyr-binding forkhead associated (FHA) protein
MPMFKIFGPEVEGREEPEEPSEIIVIDKDLIRVGKIPSSDLYLPHAMVSRTHAVIEGDYVIDLGSAYGTHINDKKVVKGQFKTGDWLRFGNVRVRVEDCG